MPEEADRVIATITEQIQAMHAGAFSDDEVDRARRYLAGAWVFDFQSVEQRAERLLELERWGLDLDEPLHWPDRIAAITPRQVRKAARSHLGPTPSAASSSDHLAEHFGKNPVPGPSFPYNIAVRRSRDAAARSNGARLRCQVRRQYWWRGPGGRAVTRPASIEEKDRVLSEDSLSEDLKLNDAWLVEHARHGDNQSFAVLLRRYERKLIRVLTRLVDDPEQARDLAQETFWRVYSRLDRFDTSRRFGPWLFRLAINLGLDWIRHNKRDYLRPGSIDWIATNGQAGFELPDPDPRIQIELAQEVQFVLGLMPICYRTILVLRDLEGFSTSEVAAIVGRRESTVRWRLSVAREKFREIWERRQAIVRDTTDRIPKRGGADDSSRV